MKSQLKSAGSFVQEESATDLRKDICGCLSRMNRAINRTSLDNLPEDIKMFQEEHDDISRYLKRALVILPQSEVQDYRARREKLNDIFLDKIC